MLTYTKLGDKMRKYLYVYEGSEHPHTAQKKWILNKEIKKCQERKRNKLIRALAD